MNVDDLCNTNCSISGSKDFRSGFRRPRSQAKSTHGEADSRCRICDSVLRCAIRNGAQVSSSGNESRQGSVADLTLARRVAVVPPGFAVAHRAASPKGTWSQAHDQSLEGLSKAPQNLLPPCILPVDKMTKHGIDLFVVRFYSGDYDGKHMDL